VSVTLLSLRLGRAVQVFDSVRVRARLCLRGEQQYKYYGFVVPGAQRIVGSVRPSYLSCLEERTRYRIVYRFGISMSAPRTKRPVGRRWEEANDVRKKRKKADWTVPAALTCL
jgi:hypothetical protein